MGHGERRAAVTAALALVAALALMVPAATAVGEHRARVKADVGDQLSRTSEKHEHPPGTFENSIIEAAHTAAEQDGPLARNPSLPTGFADVKVISGVTEATSADFAPDGTAFVALKTGVIKTFNYNGTTWTQATVNFADLSTQVNNYHDRGLTGIAVDPQFPTRPYVYVNYTYNKDPRDGPNGVVPKWGVPGQAYDECPAPAIESDPSITGCVVQDRVTRLTAVKSGNNWVLQSEKQLMVGGCYQFGSHASGDVAFGPDGKLYASSGEGASFNTLDYGQYSDPCGDPTNEGGSLRSQDYRTAADLLGVDGSVVKMDPDNGFTPSQGTANSWLVAYGQRNPWRLAFRPKSDGTGLSKELWSGDVGASKAEEVNRIADVTTVTSPINRGWPCYEGNYVASAVQPGWDALNLPLCENLYAEGTGAVVKPYFSYQTRDGGPLVPGEDCFNETSSVSGVAFGTSQSNYPAAYKGAMFFADYARSCIWALGKKANGEPDPTAIQNFVEAAETPVDLLTGPGGDLYYVDYGLNDEFGVGDGEAGVHRIVYTGSNGTPTARITANPASGAAPLDVSFSGATSTDPDGDALTYRWDFTNDGTYDATGVAAAHTYATGTYTAKLEVNDGHGHTATATQQIQAGNTAPTLGTVTPSASLTWAVGDPISFSASATDPQQGTMPASAFSWQVSIEHCPSGVCHSHTYNQQTGVASGSFTAPPHEYPSHLLLTVTVTDSGGLTDSRTVQLDPKTVPLSFASAPIGATVTVGETAHTAPYSETFIQKSPVTVTAAPTTGSGTTIAAFSSWSDGGARSHVVTPPATATTYTATYTRPTAGLVASPTSGPAPLTVAYTASATNAPGVSGGFTYAWDLDNDGQYDDGTGATQGATYATAGGKVVGVRATDSRGATDAKSVTVSVGTNQNPVPAMSANPMSGPAPLAVSMSAVGSTDPDSDPLTYAWDTDADGQFDDGAAPTASATYSGVGSHTATVKVSDNRGGSATKSVTVTATNAAPTVTRVTTYPAGGFFVGQTLGFDAAATDPQQTLPDSAYSFAMERQDCASGCPRVEVQRWTDVRSGQFAVPELPYPSHLYLVATATDAHGATGRSELRIDPQPASLTVRTRHKLLKVTVAGEARKDGWSGQYVVGTTVRLVAKKHQVRKGVRYEFVRWSDGGARKHDVQLWAPAVTVKAVYRRLR